MNEPPVYHELGTRAQLALDDAKTLSQMVNLVGRNCMAPLFQKNSQTLKESNDRRAIANAATDKRAG